MLPAIQTHVLFRAAPSNAAAPQCLAERAGRGAREPQPLGSRGKKGALRGVEELEHGALVLVFDERVFELTSWDTADIALG